MALFHDWPGMFIITLLCLLGWFSGIVMGQFYISETISGSVSFPGLGLTCLGNLAVFFTTFIRGRLYWEIGAKDLLATLAAPKLKNIIGLGYTDGFGLTTCEDRQRVSDCSVVMLSKESPTSSMTQFVEYIANVYNVRSVILQYCPLDSLPPQLNVENCRDENCRDENGRDTCSCIVFWTGTDESIIKMLAQQIPGTIKRLSDSRWCLLPSARCLINGCHGCKIVENDVLREGHSQVENDVLRDGQSQVEPPAAVCELLDILLSFSRIGEPGSCMCIPLRPKAEDDWTELLITSFKCKDNFTERGLLTRQYVTSASRALENYMAGSGQCDAEDEYGTASVIVPRLVEILINLLLTFWFKLDAFSSALVSRKAIRQYIVDDNGRGFAASAFMTRARVISNANNNNVCQALYFRGNLLTLRTLAFIVACVNLICFVSWTVLVGLEGSTNKWYHNHSVSPSKLRVVVIMVAIVIALCMDGIDLYLLRCCPESPPGPLPHWQRQLQRQQNLPDLRYRQGQLTAALQQQLLLVQELEQLLRLLQEQEQLQEQEELRLLQEREQEELLRLLQEQEQEELRLLQEQEQEQEQEEQLQLSLQWQQWQRQRWQQSRQRQLRLRRQQLLRLRQPQLQWLWQLHQVQELEQLLRLLQEQEEQQPHEQFPPLLQQQRLLQLQRQLQLPLWLQLQRLIEQQLLPEQQQRLREQRQELSELLQEEHQRPQQGQPTLPVQHLPNKRKKIHMVYTMIILEIIYIVLGIVIAKTMGLKSFGRWVYTILQSFVWVKWGIGSFLLGHYSQWFLKIRFGMYVYSSAFLLNAILAGVQAKWEYS